MLLFLDRMRRSKENFSITARPSSRYGYYLQGNISDPWSHHAITVPSFDVNAHLVTA